MKILIDGAQGTGKSTLAELFKNKGFRHKRYTSENFMTEKEIEESCASKDDFIYERGIISEAVYATLWNEDKKVITRSRFAHLIENVDYIFILYSSIDQMLYDRIKKRERESGRTVPDWQLELLCESNQLFKGYAEFLRMIDPAKVFLIDVYHCPNTMDYMQFLIDGDFS